MNELLRAIKSFKSEPEDRIKENDTTLKTPLVLTKDFVKKFKQKRRRFLLHKMRKMRSKEKIASFAIILAQLQRLRLIRNDLSVHGPQSQVIRTLKRLNELNGRKKLESDQTFENHCTRQFDGNDRHSNDNTWKDASISFEKLTDDQQNGHVETNIGYSSDYNTLSMEISDSEESGMNKTVETFNAVLCSEMLRKHLKGLNSKGD